MFPDTDVKIDVNIVYKQYELGQQQRMDEQMKAI